MQNQPIPTIWVDKIFQTLLFSYGSKFSSQWHGVDPEPLKAHWADKLGGFRENPEAIAHALRSLEDAPFPPTLPEFVALCRQAPRKELPALPAPPADVEKQRAFSRELQKVVSGGNRGADPIFWATHPKGHQAFDFIRNAAIEMPTKFQPCIDHLVATGRVSSDGQHLLQRYAGAGEWVKA